MFESKKVSRKPYTVAFTNFSGKNDTLVVRATSPEHAERIRATVQARHDTKAGLI